MKNIRSMNIGEIEAELIASREKDKQLEKELDKLISFIQEFKSKMVGSQTSLPLDITTNVKKKSIPQRIVELIKENSGKFTSIDLYDYFVKDGTFKDVEFAKKNMPAYISRLYKVHQCITHENNGDPWIFVKDFIR